MPLLLLPALAGFAGFAGGFWAGGGLNKIVKVGVVAGGGYLVYKYYIRGNS